MAEVSQTTSAATDVPEFLSDLDGGIFERKLSIAMSQVAAAVVDNDRAGSVSIAFGIKRIPGTSQVHVEHTLKFTKPTADGEAGEKESRTTPMFVGKFGKLTIAPENQMPFLDKKGQLADPK